MYKLSPFASQSPGFVPSGFPFLKSLSQKRQRDIEVCRPTIVCRTEGCFVIGGTSGVGLEVSLHLESQGVKPISMSRRTGHDFSRDDIAQAALRGQTGIVAICIGGGRRTELVRDEVHLYENVARAVASMEQVTVSVTIVRTLILPEVRKIFSNLVTSPWILLRPGPLIDFPDSSKASENLLVTEDIRCNGLVSRKGVATVAGDLLLGKIALGEIEGRDFGVYDRNRMINIPRGITTLGEDVWVPTSV